MNDQARTKKQLLADLHELRQRVAELECRVSCPPFQTADRTPAAPGHHAPEQASICYDEAFTQAVVQARANISCFDIERGLFIASAEARRLHGLDPEGPIDQAAAITAIHPDDWPEVERVFRRSTETGAPYVVEYRVILNDGSIRWIAAQGERLPGLFGSRLMIMSQDITERRRTEDLLRARLRLVEFAESHSLESVLQATLDEAEALTDSAISFYHFLDADQRTLSLQAWSTSTLQLGCTSQGQGLHYDLDRAGVWVDCVHVRRPVIYNDYVSLSHRKGTPAGHASLTRVLLVPIMRGESIVAIIGMGNKAGRYVNDDIATVSLLGDFSWDIVERKRTKISLREARDFAESLIETANVMVVGLDRYGSIVTFNKAAELITGYSRNELAGRNWFETLVPRVRYPQVWDAFQRVDAGMLPENFENPILTRSGEERYIVWQNSVMYRDERPAGTISFGMDITERRQMEEDLRKSRDELDERVHQATADLRASEAQLRQLSSHLLQAQENERKRVANEIHDNAGQVLAAIKYRVEAASLKLEKAGLGHALQPVRELVPIVQACMNDMRRLQMELRPTVLDDMGVKAAIEWFCREFQITYPAICVETTLMAHESELSEVLKLVIFRIVQEALNNVGKHSNASRIRIALQVRGESLMLQIADNGQGFDVEQALTVKAFGHGLGLSSMRERAQFSGGVFFIDSTLGEGTQIDVRWPRHALV